MKKTLHVIPHSHWDREWYVPFEKHRVRLVELFDTQIMKRWKGMKAATNMRGSMQPPRRSAPRRALIERGQGNQIGGKDEMPEAEMKEVSPHP